MVVYDLLCGQNHKFEGWFPSFEGYQEQAKQGLVSCPTCGTTEVEKLPHACAVHVKKEAQTAPPPQENATPSFPSPDWTADRPRSVIAPQGISSPRRFPHPRPEGEGWGAFIFFTSPSAQKVRPGRRRFHAPQIVLRGSTARENRGTAPAARCDRGGKPGCADGRELADLRNTSRR